MVDRVSARLAAERGVVLTVDEALVSRLAREGFDEEYGARPLQRHVRRTLEKALTKAILDGTLVEGTRVRAADGADGAIALHVEQEAAPLPLAA